MRWMGLGCVSGSAGAGVWWRWLGGRPESTEILISLCKQRICRLVSRVSATRVMWQKQATAGLERLQAGEQAAILLAESMKADIILLDEKAARRVAANRGLRVTGLLGVLSEAATRGLVELAPAIDRLRMTNFRSSPALLKATVDRFGKPAGMLNGKWPDQSIKLTA